MTRTLISDFAEDGSLVSRVGPTYICTRADTATFYDWDGVLRTVQANEARFTGWRRVENVILNSIWAGSLPLDDWSRPATDDGATAVTGSITGSTAYRFQSSAGREFFRQNLALNLNTTYTLSFYVEAIDAGTNGACVYLSGLVGATGPFVTAGNLTLEPDDLTVGERFSTTITTAADGVGLLDIGAGAQANATHDLTFSAFQIEIVSGQDDPAPSEYQATTTVAVAKNYKTRRRTNLLFDTVDLSNDPTWTIGIEATVVEDTSDFPDIPGVTNSWELLTTVDNTQHEITQSAVNNDNLDHSNSFTRITHSICAKAIPGSTTPEMMVQCLANGNHQRIAFDLTSGAITETNSAIDPITGVPLPDGWWYFEWSYLPAPGFSSHYFTVMPHDGVSASGIFVGDGTGIKIAAPQFEHADRATAYLVNESLTNVVSSAFNVSIPLADRPGVLPEEARENICLESSDLSTTWSESGDALAVVGNEATAPDGTLTADLLVDDSSTGNGNVYVNQVINIVIDTEFVYAAFLKPNGNDWAHLNVVGLGALTTSAFFELTGDGAVGATVGANNNSEFIHYIRDGWYLCGIQFTSDAADSTGSIRVNVADADGDLSVPLDGTSSIFVWGVDLQIGQFLQSHIPTILTSESRAEDDFDTTDLSWFNPDGTGSWFVSGEFAAGAGVGGTLNDFGVFQVYNATTERLPLYVNNGAAQASFVNGGYTGDALSVPLNAQGNYVANQPISWALRFFEDDAIAFQEGLEGGDDTACDVTLPFTFDKFTVGKATLSSTAYWGSHIARLEYDPDYLSNEQLASWSLSGEYPGGGGGVTRLRRANDAADWAWRRKLKREDDEAMKLVNRYLNY